MGDRLRDEIRLFSETDLYRAQNEELEAGFARRGDEIISLRRQLRTAPDARRTYTLAEIKAMSPGDPFVRSLVNLVEGQEGPFRRTLRDEVVRVSVIAGGGREPQFNICGNVLEKLNEGAEAPSPFALVTRSRDGAGTPVRARRAGRIGDDFCEGGERDFDVQINCPLALALFAEELPTCASARSVRGSKVTIGSLAN